jgi:DNA-binding transcriptional LysR family regulator
VRPEVRHLAYFVALAEELNFTRAAARLNVVQQALSAGVAQLETLVGVRLFERTTRRVRMTAAGEDFLPRAREALAAVDLALATARRHADGAAGHLAVGLSSTTGLPATPRLLRAFADRYPEVELEVRHFTFADPYAGLLTGETDVAILRPPLSTALELHELAREPRYVTLPSDHPLAGRDEIAFAEVADEPWMDTDTDPVWCAFWMCAEHRTRPPRVGAICTSLDELFEAARAGRALGMVPESVAWSRAWPGLAFVRVADVEPSVAAVACRPGEARHAVRNFLALAGSPSAAPPSARP